MGIWQAATAPLGSRGEAKSREGLQAPLAAPTLLADAQSLLRRFVAYVDPTVLRGLSQEDGEEVDEVPIADWSILHTSSSGSPSSMPDLSPSIVVRAHPAPNKHLFSVQFVVPGVTARQFWTLMANTANRYLWDGSIEEGDVKRWLHADAELDEREAGIAAALGAKVEYMRFGSM